MFEELLSIALKSIFVENILLAYFLGMCSFLAVSKKVETAVGLGVAVIFVLTITAPVNWALNEYLLRDGALAWAGFPDIDLSFLQFAQQISGDPVRSSLGGATRPRGLLEEIGEVPARCQNARVVGRQRKFGFEARPFLFGQLWHFCPYGFDTLRIDPQWDQIGIGEITIVVRILLESLNTGSAPHRVESHRRLNDFATVVDQFGLPQRFGFDRVLDIRKGVQILDFGPRAQIFRAA